MALYMLFVDNKASKKKKEKKKKLEGVASLCQTCVTLLTSDWSNFGLRSLNQCSSSHRCLVFCYGFRVERQVSWKRCATGFEMRFLLFGECVKNVSPISSNMYINHTVLKRPLAQWVQVKSFNVSAAARYKQQLKISEDMFVVRVL